MEKLKNVYGASPMANQFRPSAWSLIMAITSAGGLGLSAAAQLPRPLLLYPVGAIVGYAYTYNCFQDSDDSSVVSNVLGRSQPASPASDETVTAGGAAAEADRRRARVEKRKEGYLAGIGTSALLASGQVTAYRQVRNPISLNLLLLSAASAFYYSGLMMVDSGE